jgi:hypothetical protein
VPHLGGDDGEIAHRDARDGVATGIRHEDVGVGRGGGEAQVVVLFLGGTAAFVVAVGVGVRVGGLAGAAGVGGQVVVRLGREAQVVGAADEQEGDEGGSAAGSVPSGICGV